MTEQEKKFGKKDTYTYEEVRSMIESANADRARYLGFFYKVMPRELFDLYAKKALFAYGEYKAKNPFFDKYNKGDLNAMTDFLESTNGVSATPSIGIYAVEKTKDHHIINMDGKCALVEGWKGMGFSPEEVDYLCLIASYGDFGHCHALGLEGEWLQTSTKPGCDHCVFKVEVEKENGFNVP